MSTLVRSSLMNMQVFTSTGTFTVPNAVYRIKVTVTGGGGHGATGAYITREGHYTAGAGGGGGGTAINFVDVVPGDACTVIVAGATGTSSFITGSFMVQGTGGASGSAAFNESGPSRGGAGGVGIGGTLNIYGSSGGGATISQIIVNDFDGSVFGLGKETAGVGGGSIWGQGGGNAHDGGPGYNASTYGTGGGGGFGPGYPGFGVRTSPGGAGFQGVVVIEW